MKLEVIIYDNYSQNFGKMSDGQISRDLPMCTITTPPLAKLDFAAHSNQEFPFALLLTGQKRYFRYHSLIEVERPILQLIKRGKYKIKNCRTQSGIKNLLRRYEL